MFRSEMWCILGDRVPCSDTLSVLLSGMMTGRSSVSFDWLSVETSSFFSLKAYQSKATEHIWYQYQRGERFRSNFPQSCYAEETLNLMTYSVQRASHCSQNSRLVFCSSARLNSAQHNKNLLSLDLLEDVARKQGSDVTSADVMWQQYVSIYLMRGRWWTWLSASSVGRSPCCTTV